MGNERLRAQRKLRGWSQEDVVRGLVRVGIEINERQLGVTRQLISRWERGITSPRAPYPKLLCQLFQASAEELGLYEPEGMGARPTDQSPMAADELPCNVWVEGIPVAEPPFDRTLEFAPSLADSIMVVAELWRADVERREFLVDATFAAGALILPSWQWSFGSSDEQAAKAGGMRVGMADIERIRSDTEAFSQMDQRNGGGHARWLVVSYLDRQVAPLLQGTYAEEVGRELFGAAAVLTRRAGVMAHDAGKHGLAQRYYVQALRLAHAAGDRALGAYVLTQMALLALYLGQPSEAAELARAARQGANGTATPNLVGRIFAIEARAHAQLDDKSGCDRALSRSTAEFERAERSQDPNWLDGVNCGEAYLAWESAHCLRDLHQGSRAVEFADIAIIRQETRQVRRRALGTVLLASSYVEKNELERASEIGLEAVALVGQMKSQLGLDAIRDLRGRLAQHTELGVAKEFDERTEVFLGDG